MKVVRLEDCIKEIKSLDNCGVITRSTNHICEDVRTEIREFEAVPITDNATNGDVVEKIFGKDIYFTLIGMMYVSCCKKFDKWWNAPYKM